MSNVQLLALYLICGFIHLILSALVHYSSKEEGYQDKLRAELVSLFFGIGVAATVAVALVLYAFAFPIILIGVVDSIILLLFAWRAFALGRK